MINRVILVGRLTRDPELRYTPNGTPVTTFTLAVNRTFTNQQGEREADFIQCVVWRKAAENVANYLRKGSLAGVDGRWQTRSYEGDDGKKVYVNECIAESVQFLDSKREGSQGGNVGYQSSNQSNYQPGGQPSNQTSYQQNYQQSDPFANSGNPIDIDDDSLPF